MRIATPVVFSLLVACNVGTRELERLVDGHTFDCPDRFCIDDELFHCSPVTRVYTSVEDCKKIPKFLGIKYVCGPCPGTTVTECRPEKPDIKGFITWDGRTVPFEQYASCPNRVLGDGALSSFVRIGPSNVKVKIAFKSPAWPRRPRPDITLDYPSFSGHVSGKIDILWVSKTPPLPEKVIDLRIGGGFTTIRTPQPPSLGTIKISYSGKSKGSSYRIISTGFALKAKWTAFTFDISGLSF